MLLAQGSELSRASLAVIQLVQRLEGALGIGQDDQDKSEITDSASESLLALPPLANLAAERRSSQFLITPTEDVDLGSEFSRALMIASTGSEAAADSISSLARSIADRQQCEGTESSGHTAVPFVASIVDQLATADSLLGRLLSTTASTSSLKAPVQVWQQFFCNSCCFKMSKCFKNNFKFLNVLEMFLNV